MSQHYQQSVKQVMVFCNTCNRKTMHRVDQRRIGSCTEHQASGESDKQRKAREQREIEAQQPELF
jgi:ribosomal protein L44E